jgi:hypothetical protein
MLGPPVRKALPVRSPLRRPPTPLIGKGDIHEHPRPEGGVRVDLLQWPRDAVADLETRAIDSKHDGATNSAPASVSSFVASSPTMLPTLSKSLPERTRQREASGVASTQQPALVGRSTSLLAAAHARIPATTGEKRYPSTRVGSQIGPARGDGPRVGGPSGAGKS